MTDASFVNTFILNIFFTIFQDCFQLPIGYSNVSYLAHLFCLCFLQVLFLQFLDFVGHNTLELYMKLIMYLSCMTLLLGSNNALGEKRPKTKRASMTFQPKISVIIISQVDRIVLCSCQTLLTKGKRYKCICSCSCNFIRHLQCCLCPCSGLHLMFVQLSRSQLRSKLIHTHQHIHRRTHTHDAHRVCDVLSQAIHTILQALSIIRVLWMMMRVFTKTYDMPHVATYNDVWSRHTHRSVKYLADTFVCRRLPLG